MFDFVWMDPDGRIHEGILICERDCCLAGRQIAADGDERLNSGFPCAGNDCLSVVIVARIIQVGMSVDQHRGAHANTGFSS